VRWRIWSAAFAVVALGLLARADDPPKKADDKKPDEKQAEPKTPAEKVAAVRKSIDEALSKARTASTEAQKAAKDKDAKDEDKKEKQEAFQKALSEYQKAMRDAGPKYLALAKEFPADPAALDAIQQAMQSGRGGLSADAIKIVKEHHLKSPKLAGLIQSLMNDESPAGEELLKAIAAESTENSVKGPAMYALASRKVEKLTGYDSQATKADYDKVKPEVEKALDAVAKDYAEVSFGRGKLGDQVKRLQTQMEKVAARLIGMPAPEIEAEDVDGKKFKLSDYKGKVVMIDFWGDW
jgi:hypothetical protein